MMFFLSPDISVDIRCVDITCFDRAIRVSTMTLPRQHSLSHFNVYYKLGKGQFRYTGINVCTTELDCERLLVIIMLADISSGGGAVVDTPLSVSMISI